MAAQPNKGTGEASAGLPRPPGCARHKGMARQSEASLAMSRKGWSQRPEYFQARTKYLQLADKAARTVMMLTERLDHHRPRPATDHRQACPSSTRQGCLPQSGWGEAPNRK